MSNNSNSSNQNSNQPLGSDILKNLSRKALKGKSKEERALIAKAFISYFEDATQSLSTVINSSGVKLWDDPNKPGKEQQELILSEVSSLLSKDSNAFKRFSELLIKDPAFWEVFRNSDLAITMTGVNRFITIPQTGYRSYTSNMDRIYTYDTHGSAKDAMEMFMGKSRSNTSFDTMVRSIRDAVIASSSPYSMGESLSRLYFALDAIKRHEEALNKLMDAKINKSIATILPNNAYQPLEDVERSMISELKKEGFTLVASAQSRKAINDILGLYVYKSTSKALSMPEALDTLRNYHPQVIDISHAHRNAIRGTKRHDLPYTPYEGHVTLRSLMSVIRYALLSLERLADGEVKDKDIRGHLSRVKEFVSSSYVTNILELTISNSKGSTVLNSPIDTAIREAINGVDPRLIIDSSASRVAIADFIFLKLEKLEKFHGEDRYDDLIEAVLLSRHHLELLCYYFGREELLRVILFLSNRYSKNMSEDVFHRDGELNDSSEYNSLVVAICEKLGLKEDTATNKTMKMIKQYLKGDSSVFRPIAQFPTEEEKKTALFIRRITNLLKDPSFPRILRNQNVPKSLVDKVIHHQLTNGLNPYGGRFLRGEWQVPARTVLSPLTSHAAKEDFVKKFKNNK